MTGARLTISVDDGHPLDMRMADLLARHGMRATFYVPISNAEGLPVLTGEQLRLLAQDFELGSHTLSHRALVELDERAAWHQVFDGKQALEDLVGMPVHGFCYPLGRYQRVHLRQVQAAGFSFARTTQNLRLDPGHDRFELPTTAQFYPHVRSVWVRNYVSQFGWSARTAPLIAALMESDWLIRLHRLLALADSRGGTFHLWCHTIDIERLGLWESFERFLAAAALRVPPARRMTNGEMLSLLPAAMPPEAAYPTSPYRESPALRSSDRPVWISSKP